MHEYYIVVWILSCCIEFILLNTYHVVYISYCCIDIILLYRFYHLFVKISSFCINIILLYKYHLVVYISSCCININVRKIFTFLLARNLISLPNYVASSVLCRTLISNYLICLTWLNHSLQPWLLPWETTGLNMDYVHH